MFSESYIKCYCTVQQHLVFCQGTKLNVFFSSFLCRRECFSSTDMSEWQPVKLMVFSYSDYLAFFCNLSLFLPEIRLWSCCTMRDSGKAVIWGWAERDQRQTVNFYSQSLSLPHVTLLSQRSVFPRYLPWHVGIVIYLYLVILVVYWIFNFCMLISCFYV